MIVEFICPQLLRRTPARKSMKYHHYIMMIRLYDEMMMMVEF